MAYTPRNKSGCFLHSTPSQISSFKEIYLKFGRCAENDAVCITSIQKVKEYYKWWTTSLWQHGDGGTWNVIGTSESQRISAKKIVWQWHHKITVYNHWWLILFQSLWFCWSSPLCICILFQLFSIIYLQFPSFFGLVNLFLAI